MDNKPIEQEALSFIKNRFGKKNIAYAEPNFDVDGIDMFAIKKVNDVTYTFLSIQSKGRNLTNNQSNITIPIKYVKNNFIVFLYLKIENNNNDFLYCFFEDDIQKWKKVGENYELYIPQNFLEKKIFEQNNWENQAVSLKFQQKLQDTSYKIISEAHDIKEVLTKENIELPHWEEFYHYCNLFEKRNKKYILISPPDLTEKNYNLTERQLIALNQLPWNLIIDFNFQTKTNGIAKNLSNNPNYDFYHLDLEPNISKYGEKTYWFSANGLDKVQNAPLINEYTSSTAREWRRKTKKYFENLISQYSNYFKLQDTTIIFLWDDINFIEIFLRYFEDYLNTKSLKYAIITQNKNKIPELNDLIKDYPCLSYKIFNLPYYQIGDGILRYQIKSHEVIDDIILPSTSNNGEYNMPLKDYKLAKEKGIQIIHKNIDNIEEETDIKEFYKGERPISWKELYLDKSVKREIIDAKGQSDTAISLIKDALKKDEVNRIDLLHVPSSGGTTVARYIANEFYNKYPTIFINNIDTDTFLILNDLSDNTQVPILAILENVAIKEQNLQDLLANMKRAGKSIIFLYVKGTFELNSDYKSIKLFETLTPKECIAFYDKFEPLTNNKVMLKEIQNGKEHDKTPFVYGLTAFGKDFKGIQDYVHHRLRSLKTKGQKEFIGLLALYSYYTRKTLSYNIFSPLFNTINFNIEHEFKNIPGIFDLIRKDDFSIIVNREDKWGIRHRLIAEEILKYIFTNNAPSKNWKKYLKRWTIKFIEICKQDNEIVPEEIEDAIYSLITERNGESYYGYDTDFANSKNTQFDKFSNLFSDINNEEDGQKVYEKLVEIFPKNPHYKAHLARFYYEIGSYSEYDRNRFNKAKDIINKALEIAPNDYNIHQMNGMIYRRAIESIYKNYRTFEKNNELDTIEEEVKLLTEQSLDAFSLSIESNLDNLHAYTSSLTTIFRAIKFGQRKHRTGKKDFFKENTWYEKKLQYFINLLDRAVKLVELKSSIETSYYSKDYTYVHSFNGKLKELIGDYQSAASIFKNSLSHLTDDISKARYRLYYVVFSLANKSENNIQAWQNLNKNEAKELRKYLEENIEADPTNAYNLKLWLQSVRYSPESISLDECIDMVNEWYQNGDSLLKLDAIFYLYVLKSLQVIELGSSADNSDINKVNDLITECRNHKAIPFANDKYIIEWYGKENIGVKKLINSYQLKGMDIEQKDDLKQILYGNIKSIKPNRFGGIAKVGSIRLDCGLEAFFNPSKWEIFKKGIDDTSQTRVSFIIGFRYDGLQAFNVKRSNKEKDQIVELSDDNSNNGINEDTFKGKITSIQYNYGFIESFELDKSVFFHKTIIENFQFDFLEIDEKVEFTLKTDELGNKIVVKGKYQAESVWNF